MLAAAAICHPHFKLRWVPPEKREWAQSVFLAEAKKYSDTVADIATETNENAVHDDFFDFDTEPPSQELEGSKVIFETVGIIS